MPPRPHRRHLLLGLAALPSLALAESVAPLRIGIPDLPLSGLTGGARALIERAYADLGQPLVFLPLPLRRSLMLVARGELDGDLQRAPESTAGVEQLIQVRPPLQQLELYVYSTRAPHPATDLDGLKGLRVVHQRGYEWIAEQLGLRGIPRVEGKDHHEVLRLLREDYADVALLSQPHQLSTTMRSLLKGLHRSPQPLLRRSLFHVLHRRHAAFAERLGARLQALEASGEADRLRRSGER